MSTFGELLRKHREKKNITVSEAAQRAKIDVFAYCAWENDLKLPTVEDMVKIFGAGSTLERHLPASSKKEAGFTIHPLPPRPHRSIAEQSFQTPNAMGAALEKVGLAKAGVLTTKPLLDVPDVVALIPKPIGTPRFISIAPVHLPAPPPADDPWVLFGKHLHDARGMSGMTDQEFAALFDVDVQSLYRWEAGKRPYEHNMVKIRALVPIIAKMTIEGARYGRTLGAKDKTPRARTPRGSYVKRVVAAELPKDPSLPKDPWEAFCVILKRERQFRMLSQLEFAELVPVSAGMISQWEVGVLKPTFEHLPRLIELCPNLGALDLSDADAAPLGLVKINIVVKDPEPVAVAKPILSSDPLDVIDRVQAAFEALGRVVTYQPSRNKSGSIARLIENERSIAVGSGPTSADAVRRMLEDLRAGLSVDCNTAAEDMHNASARYDLRVSYLKSIDWAIEHSA